ncbi:putative transcription factor [Triangularia verruculosa]|uniref:General transcription and DNA repair factor IIH n=1 Tax=Triangularia verruculosa TaxID=2587418 RepID=A0AAN7AZ39_9PEZI|nr:putative transcription factor [Triangularia verruculosa]
MADSDDEYVGALSGDDAGVDSAYGTRSKDGKGKGGQKNKGNRKAAWEEVHRAWDEVAIAEDGSISVAELIEAEKRRRLMRDTTPIQRGIIRHVMLVLDMSIAMAEKDLLPNRFSLTFSYAVDFVRVFFEQNPISQLGIIGMRDGIAVRISDMSGNPAEHIEKLRQWAQKDPLGNPSLQNALEMCRGALYHTPSHGTREVLIISGAHLSSDPGDISDTITSLIADRLRVSIIGLAAQVAICAELCSRTNDNDDSQYRIALHEQHFHELFLAATTPPATYEPEQSNASLLMMGFPSRTLATKDYVSLCACHNKPTREGYSCTRCRTKVCRLPASCPVCGLTLILSTHLARSYHHLFPLKSWVPVPWAEAKKSTACYSCQTPFPPIPKVTPKIKLKVKEPSVGGQTAANVAKAKGKGEVPAANVAKAKGKGEVPARTSTSTAAPTPGLLPEAVKAGVSESGRYKCPECEEHFCIDCDIFAHEMIHNCAGCLTRPPRRQQQQTQQVGNGGGEAMEID